MNKFLLHRESDELLHLGSRNQQYKLLVLSDQLPNNINQLGMLYRKLGHLLVRNYQADMG